MKEGSDVTWGVESLRQRRGVEAGGIKRQDKDEEKDGIGRRKGDEGPGDG